MQNYYIKTKRKKKDKYKYTPIGKYHYYEQVPDLAQVNLDLVNLV